MGTAPRELTGEEAALYDRQIRLWGLEAQRKLASSHVLLTGSVVSPLGHEIAKNVLLSGVARLALCETSGVREPSFLGEDMEHTVNSLREMNPHVEVVLHQGAVADIVKDFKVVCAIGVARKEEMIVAEACRKAEVAFMCGRVCGMVGWLFLDLGPAYVYQEKVKGGEGGMGEEKKAFCTYKEAVGGNWGGEGRFSEFGWHVASVLMEFEEREGNLPGEGDGEKLLALYKQFCQEKESTRDNKELVEVVGKSSAFSLPPVAAIVGGMWGREIVKVVSGRDEPLNNFFFFNLKTSAGSVERVGPKKIV